ncbi:MAG: tagatose 1,6-diphosphate aldolase [Anaerolineales bacterium]
MKPKVLSIGKRRGLTSTSTEQNVFSILAFDHRQSFVKMVNPGSKDPASYQEVVSAKLDVIKTLAPVASGVLLDPLYGAFQAIARNELPAKTGLLVAVEKTGYSGKSTARSSTLLPDWGVPQIKKMGGDAVKLLIYYHPEGGELTEKQDQLTTLVAQQCRDHDIAFFLEAVSYSIDPNQNKNSIEFAKDRPSLIARLVRRLSSLEPDILKIEFPVDSNHHQDQTFWREACLSISDVSKCPWTVLSAGVDFEVFEDQVKIACQAGASGFIGGRAVWKEGIPLQSAERVKWLRDVAHKRLTELNEIAEKYARPWTDFYPSQELDQYQDWYKKYS